MKDKMNMETLKPLLRVAMLKNVYEFVWRFFFYMKKVSNDGRR